MSEGAMRAGLVFRLRPVGFKVLVRVISSFALFVVQMSVVIVPDLVFAKTVLITGNSVILPVNHSDASLAVMMDKRDATAFARVIDGAMELDIPFPDNPSVFEIQVLDTASGELLYQQSYRMASSSGLFGDINVAASGQIDTSLIKQTMPASEFTAIDGSDELTSDMIGSVTVATQRDGSYAGLELEAVHNSNGESTLRPDGPQTDLSRFAVTTEISNRSGHRLYLDAGDTHSNSSNPLVNTGIQSRGFVVGYQTGDQRVKIEASRFYGADVIGTVQGPLGWSTESYRTSASVDLKSSERDQVTWSVHGSVLDVKRPQEDSFLIGQTPDGETNRVWGVGFDFGFLRDRLRLSLAWAASEYDNPLSLNDVEFRGDGDLNLFQPGATTGNAYRHALNWDAWQGDIEGLLTSVSFEVGTEQATPLFRSVHGTSIADRRQWSAAMNVIHGALSGRFDTTRYRNNVGNLISIHTLAESASNASLSVDLNALRTSHRMGQVVQFEEQVIESTDATDSRDDIDYSALRSLIPSSIGISTRVQDTRTLNGDDIILAPVIDGFDFMDQTSTSFSLSAAWYGMYSSTTLEMNHVFLNIDQRERASADRRDTHYGLSHSLHRDSWSLGMRLGFTETDDLDPASKSSSLLTDWGINGSYSSPRGIDVSASFDRNRNRLHDLVLSDESISVSKRYSLTVGAGGWIGRKLNLNNSPSVTASWQKTVSDAASYFFSSKTSSSSVTLNMGVSF